ncbi:MAG: hypothetical protein ACFB2Y_06860 [Fulvivirga sp.]
MRLRVGLFFSLLNIVCHAQEISSIDNLYEEAKKQRSIEIARKALSHATDSNNIQAMAKIHFLIGYYENQKRMYYNALNSYFKALKYYTETGNITRRYLTVMNIAMIFEKGHFLTESLNLYDNARELALKENDSLTTARIDYYRARINRLSKNYSVAESLYQKAMKQFELLKNNYMINETFAELGLLYEQKDNMEKALQYYASSIRPDKKGHIDPYAKVRQMNSVAYCMLSLKSDPDSVQRLLFDALELAKDKDGLDYLKAKIFGNLAKVYQIEQRADSAITLFEESLNYLKPKDYSIEYLHTTKLVADYYLKTDPAKADEYQDKIYSFAEELAILQQQLRQSFIQYQVEAAKFKQESLERYEAQLRQQFYHQIAYVAIVALLILFFIQRQRKRQRATLILKKQGAI